jgi:hypothetical protein
VGRRDYVDAGILPAGKWRPEGKIDAGILPAATRKSEGVLPAR